MASSRWSGVWSGLRKAAGKVPSGLCDMAGFVGAALISYGAWLVYAPAGFIVGGSLLIAFAMLAGRRLDAGAA